MKTLLLRRLVPLVVLLPVPALAQIRDNESSRTILAFQCALSSGYSPEDFEDYSRRLAKTLGMLNNAQQTRVFGFLPNPGGGGSSDDSASTPYPSATTEAAPMPGPVQNSDASAPKPDGSADLSRGLVGVTEEEWLKASGSPEAPVTPELVSAALQAEASSGGGKTSAWGSFMAWLRRAEEAYKNGTLSDQIRQD
jgi:hypothetical protein